MLALLSASDSHVNVRGTRRRAVHRALSSWQSLLLILLLAFGEAAEKSSTICDAYPLALLQRATMSSDRQRDTTAGAIETKLGHGASCTTQRGVYRLCRTVEERGRVVKYRAFVEPAGGPGPSVQVRPVSWSEALQLWQQPGGGDFTALFHEALREADFAAYFFEAPHLTASTLGRRDFEFILRGSQRLEGARPDARAFAEHLTPCSQRGTAAAVFENLGGDAMLVAPCPRVQNRAYTHLANFVRHAPEEQVLGLWAEVGAAAAARIQQHGERPVWLSTSGLGVYWLHVRMDEHPKYYTYQPYVNEGQHHSQSRW